MTEFPDFTFFRHLCWLVTHDEEFLAKSGELIGSAVYGDPEIAFFVHKAVEYQSAGHGLMTPDALAVYLDELPPSKGFSKSVCADIWNELKPVEGEGFRDFVAQYARDWVHKQGVKRDVEQLQLVLEDGLLADAADLVEKIRLGVVQEEVEDGELALSAVLDADVFDGLLDERYGDGETASRAVPTGIPTIDHVFRGGLRPAELAVMAAPPGMGKSQWLTYAGRHAWESGFNVLYYTLEMSKTVVYERFWASIVDMDSSTIGSDLKRFKKERDKFIRSNGYDDESTPMPDIWVKEYPQMMASTSTIYSHLLEMFDKHLVPDLVVLDYADILASSRRYNSTYEEVAHVYNELRGSIAQKLDVPVWTASQINREGASRKRARMVDLAKAWEKAMVADYILLWHTDEQMKAEGRGEISFLKARNNAVPDDIVLKTDFSRSYFQELRAAKSSRFDDD